MASLWEELVIPIDSNSSAVIAAIDSKSKYPFDRNSSTYSHILISHNQLLFINMSNSHHTVIHTLWWHSVSSHRELYILLTKKNCMKCYNSLVQQIWCLSWHCQALNNSKILKMYPKSHPLCCVSWFMMQHVYLIFKDVNKLKESPQIG